MKFAKELEEDLVPEWRIKYFNYKLGKKKIKAVSRSLRNVNRTPQVSGRPQLNQTTSDEQLTFTHYDFNKRGEHASSLHTPNVGNGPQSQTRRAPASARNSKERPDLSGRRESLTMFAHSPPVVAADHYSNETTQPPETVKEEEGEDDSGSSDSDYPKNERTPLQHRGEDRPRYGSIVGTPPDTPGEAIPALHLPDPALDPSKQKPPTIRNSSTVENNSPSLQVSRHGTNRNATSTSVDPHAGGKTASIPNMSRRIFKNRSSKVDTPFKSSTKMKRAFTTLTLDSPAISSTQFEAYRELDAKQEDFFNFLDKELGKVEKFYKQKEDEATSRLQVLRGQLHEMRDRRLKDLEAAKKGAKIADDGLFDGQIPIMSNPFQPNGHGDSKSRNLLDSVMDTMKPNGKIGKTSKAREELSTPRGSFTKSSNSKVNKNDRGDYVRKPPTHEKVPYRYAKRKLKLALQEFYRGLELLKSYALLNRTAFRKINKKYDKAVVARPPLRYMSEKVNHAHFVTSTLVEETLVTIEDLYARYFERGNRKVAVNKLRSHLRTGDRSSESFRNGLYVAAGVGFAITGFVDGSHHLFSADIRTKTEASYLFQIYGGYFLAVLLFLFFVLDCRTWTRNRINYVFVFEYDTRHVLDWRQLAELPCFFLFLNGFFFWFNFQFHRQHPTYLYWPVVMIGLTVILIFLPAKILYYRARKWFLYSNFRLLLAGLYPVEFRDFYLGDMYCSETYSMSQLEVFFCLYGTQWADPIRCNSNHSRVLGFLTTLPPIWRALQCLRRYYDSGNWFPHLANFTKYCGNVMYYMTLSLYRIHLTTKMRALFIVFAAVNGLYCSFWDVFMDFSLGNPWSKNFLLRDNLAFRKKRYYYAVMIIDVVLRQQWIAYAILTEDLQHSAVMSFVVALAEVTRRGIWSLFRVENEHCNNVVQFRASRDIPLPYSVPESRAGSIDYTRRERPDPISPKSSRTNQGRPKPMQRLGTDPVSGADIERADTSSSSLPTKHGFIQSTPALRALQRVGTVIAAAHSQDFQKKRRPSGIGQGSDEDGMMARNWSDDDEDDDDLDPRRISTATEINRQRQLDSRENVSHPTPGRGPRDETIDDGDEDDVPSRSDGSGSGSGSGSGTRTPRPGPNQRLERDPNALQRADTEDDMEIEEARDMIKHAHGPVE